MANYGIGDYNTDLVQRYRDKKDAKMARTRRAESAGRGIESPWQRRTNIRNATVGVDSDIGRQAGPKGRHYVGKGGGGINKGIGGIPPSAQIEQMMQNRYAAQDQGYTNAIGGAMQESGMNRRHGLDMNLGRMREDTIRGGQGLDFQVAGMEDATSRRGQGLTYDLGMANNQSAMDIATMGDETARRGQGLTYDLGMEQYNHPQPQRQFYGESTPEYMDNGVYHPPRNPYNAFTGQPQGQEQGQILNVPAPLQKAMTGMSPDDQEYFNGLLRKGVDPFMLMERLKVK